MNRDEARAALDARQQSQGVDLERQTLQDSEDILRAVDLAKDCLADLRPKLESAKTSAARLELF